MKKAITKVTGILFIALARLPTRVDWGRLKWLFHQPAGRGVSWGQNRLDIFGLGGDNKASDGNQWLPCPLDWDRLGAVSCKCSVARQGLLFRAAPVPMAAKLARFNSDQCNFYEPSLQSQVKAVPSAKALSTLV
jgi:hypothetical protein